MINKLQKEEKLTIIKALIEKIQREHNCKVKFINEDRTILGSYTDCKELIEDVRSILKVANMKLVIKQVEEGVELSGELDFNEAVDISDKLRTKGLMKTESVIKEGKSYLTFKTPNDKYKVLIPKPNK